MWREHLFRFYTFDCTGALPLRCTPLLIGRISCPVGFSCFPLHQSLHPRPSCTCGIGRRQRCNVPNRTWIRSILLPLVWITPSRLNAREFGRVRWSEMSSLLSASAEGEGKGFTPRDWGTQVERTSMPAKWIGSSCPWILSCKIAILLVERMCSSDRLSHFASIRYCILYLGQREGRGGIEGRRKIKPGSCWARRKVFYYDSQNMIHTFAPYRAGDENRRQDALETFFFFFLRHIQRSCNH